MFGGKVIDLNLYKNESGVYKCARCGHPLFKANERFDAGCGFPSFWQTLQNGVEAIPLYTYGRSRIQLVCQKCKLHLGHVFQNSHTPTGKRFCINGDAIVLDSEEQQ